MVPGEVNVSPSGEPDTRTRSETSLDMATTSSSLEDPLTPAFLTLKSKVTTAGDDGEGDWVREAED